jgi:hypothetical protein
VNHPINYFNKRVAIAGIDANGLSDLLAAGLAKLMDGFVAGFWIWTVKDMDEAVAWVKKCPNPKGPSVIEIRPFFEEEDFKEWGIG